MIMDLDETMIPTNHHYQNALYNFHNFVANTFDDFRYSFDDISDKHIERQLELIKEFGFDTEVFANSLKDVYLDIAKEFGVNSVEIISGANIVYNLGKSVFNEGKWLEAGLYSGVKDTLEFLIDQGADLEMVTLGDDAMQRKKVEVMELSQWFPEDKIHVVLREKYEKIKELSQDRDKKDIYFVGDSYKNDILPSIKAGINAIYIPRGKILQDEVFDESHLKITRLASFSDLRNIYNYLP